MNHIRIFPTQYKEEINDPEVFKAVKWFSSGLIQEI